MKRDYDSGVTSNALIFTGIEVEKTCFEGQKTLFVVGHQPVDVLTKFIYAERCTHVYLGANHSATPTNVFGLISLACDLIYDHRINVTLDIDIRMYEYALRVIRAGGIGNLPEFCLMVSSKLPHIEEICNSYIKVDDNDFKFSNSGVWVHKATNGDQYTDWGSYTKDRILLDEKR